MKNLLLLILIFSSLGVFSKEEKIIRKSKKKNTEMKITDKHKTKAEIPCDSKDDLLKKLKEKEKENSEKAKGFSLQGGDTGCSVK